MTGYCAKCGNQQCICDEIKKYNESKNWYNRIDISFYTGREFYINLLPYLRCYIQDDEIFRALQFSLSLFIITLNVDIVVYKKTYKKTIKEWI